MKLQNNYYELVGVRQMDRNVLFHVRLKRDCAVYAGHFPGNPICPGVFGLQMIKELAEKVVNRRLNILTIKKCRFIAPLTPERNEALMVDIRLSQSASGYTCTAAIMDEEQLYVEYQGELQL